MSGKLVTLRALRGFNHGNHYVRRGSLTRKSPAVASSLVKNGYAELVPSPIEAMVDCARKHGVALVISHGTKDADEIVREAARGKVAVVDQRRKRKGKETSAKEEEGKGKETPEKEEEGKGKETPEKEEEGKGKETPGTEPANGKE